MNETITKFQGSFRKFLFKEVCDCEASTARDIANHGIGAGWSYLTYTSDILQIHERFGREIQELVSELAEATGETIAEGFAAYCKRRKLEGDYYEYVTYLVAVAVEAVARELAEEFEKEVE